jgi:hypothetical protein
MRRADTFTLRVSERERQVLEALAQRLERTQSDAMRFLLRQEAKRLDLWPIPATPRPAAGLEVRPCPS